MPAYVHDAAAQTKRSSFSRLLSGVALVALFFILGGCSAQGVRTVNPSTLPLNELRLMPEQAANAVPAQDVGVDVKMVAAAQGIESWFALEHTPAGYRLASFLPTGERQWQKNVSVATADGQGKQSADVRLLPFGKKQVAVDDRRLDRVMLFSEEGQLLWETAGGGPFQVALTIDRSGILLLREGINQLEFRNLEGHTQWSRSVRGGSKVYALRDGFMVVDDQGIELFALNGQSKWTYQDRETGIVRKSLAAAPAGERIAVTTGANDNYLYMFGPNGNLSWKASLVPGGTKQLFFSRNGSSLLVYDVGSRSALYAFRAADGQPLWRAVLPVRSDGSTLAIRRAAIGDSGEAMLVVGEELLQLNAEGAVVAWTKLGYQEGQVLFPGTGNFLQNRGLGTIRTVARSQP